MELKVTSNDLNLIKLFYDNDHINKFGGLEIITSDGKVHPNPSWKEVQTLYQ